MFKYVYLVFVSLTLLNRIVVIKKTLKMDRAEGKIYAQWITKLVFLFYGLVFFAPPVEFFMAKREINYYFQLRINQFKAQVFRPTVLRYQT